MTIYNVLLIISVIVGVITLIISIKENNDMIFHISAISFIIAIISLIFSIIQPISLRKEMVRQNKERQQIIYQIENLTDDKDKIKLNEWILTYNDWVNDVNSEKETYGWFAWHSNFDMSNHTIIDLV